MTDRNLAVKAADMADEALAEIARAEGALAAARTLLEQQKLVLSDIDPEHVLLFDDFNGPNGSPPNPDLWWATPWCSKSADDSEGCYNPMNASLDGNGNLRLRVSKGTKGRHYDFARVQNFREGGWPPPKVLASVLSPCRFEARIKFAPGAGLWGGFWPMGVNANPPLELDIQEFRGIAPREVAIHSHGPVEGALPPYDAGVDLSADFHVYWCEYDGFDAQFGIDLTEIGVLPAPHQEMGIRLSHTVGPPSAWGGKGGPPPASAIPADMLVDYVKVTVLNS